MWSCTEPTSVALSFVSKRVNLNMLFTPTAALSAETDGSERGVRSSYSRSKLHAEPCAASECARHSTPATYFSEEMVVANAPRLHLLSRGDRKSGFQLASHFEEHSWGKRVHEAFLRGRTGREDQKLSCMPRLTRVPACRPPRASVEEVIPLMRQGRIFTCNNNLKTTTPVQGLLRTA